MATHNPQTPEESIPLQVGDLTFYASAAVLCRTEFRALCVGRPLQTKCIIVGDPDLIGVALSLMHGAPLQVRS